MSLNYGYKYACLDTDNAQCIGVMDTTDYILRRDYVPIEDDSLPYLLKYYHPIPDTVTSFYDFQGLWYSDAEFTTLVPELNA